MNPHAYLVENQLHDIIKVMESISKEFNFNPNNGIFTNSCSESLQIALNAVDLEQDDRILIMSDCNATIRKIVKGTCDKIGCGFDILQVPLPLVKLSLLLDLFEETFLKCSYKVVVLEHVCPNSGILYPIDMLIKICKRHSAVSLIYGSYAVGQIQLDISKLEADFYIGSFYKWYFSARGESFLYVSDNLKEHCWPLVDNREQNCNDPMILRRFYSDFKCDTSNFLSIAYGLDFMKHIGGLVTITEYNVKLMRWATRHLEETWNTKTIKLTRTLRSPFMSFVRLPICVERYLLSKYGPSQAPNEFIKNMLGAYEIAACAKMVDNILYCRITAHIYNTKKDYEILAAKVVEMNDELRLTTYKPMSVRMKRRKINKSNA
ncbi:hypothetical protein MXB_5195 [Myxobolus squamalis]|nr:hypothetical protein MXB_5195 [Myxobolus squamalis]